MRSTLYIAFVLLSMSGIPAFANPSAPNTDFHYGPNNNFDIVGPNYVLDSTLQNTGFNVADVSNVYQFQAMPSGVSAMVFLGMCNGADATFQSTTLSYATHVNQATSAATYSGNVLTFANTTGFAVGMIIANETHPNNMPWQGKITSMTSTTITLSANVTGTIAVGDSITGVTPPSNLFAFYLMDEPYPAGASACSPANLSAESDWIHSHFGPDVSTFIALQPLSGTFAGGYSYCLSTPCTSTNHYGNDNTNIDYFGVNAYVCRSENSGTDKCDYSAIGRNYTNAVASGVTAGNLVPVYQTFGNYSTDSTQYYHDDNGGYYLMPSVTQLTNIVNTWGSYATNPPFDYYYSWGNISPSNNHTLADSNQSDLQDLVSYVISYSNQ